MCAKWPPLDNRIRTLKWGVRNFRTLNSGVRNFRTLFRTVWKLAWGVRKWHSCARRGVRTVRKFSHLPQWCAKLDFKKFAPWKWISHLEIDFAPWGRGVRNLLPLVQGFRTLNSGVRNFRTLKMGCAKFGTLKLGALIPWFFSPWLLLKSSPHFSWFFSAIYHENWLELRQYKLRLGEN